MYPRQNHEKRLLTDMSSSWLSLRTCSIPMLASIILNGKTSLGNSKLEVLLRDSQAGYKSNLDLYELRRPERCSQFTVKFNVRVNQIWCISPLRTTWRSISGWYGMPGRTCHYKSVDENNIASNESCSAQFPADGLLT